MMQRVKQMMQQQGAKKSRVKKKKEMVTLAQVFRKLPKDLERQKVSFNGRTTFQALLKCLKMKTDAGVNTRWWGNHSMRWETTSRVGNHITCGKVH